VGFLASKQLASRPDWKRNTERKDRWLIHIVGSIRSNGSDRSNLFCTKQPMLGFSAPLLTKIELSYFWALSISKKLSTTI